MRNAEAFQSGILGHLAELRRCLLKIAAGLLLGFILSLPLSRTLFALITRHADGLIFIRPAEPLLVQLKVSFFNAILVSLPITLWQAGRFIRPALYPAERRALAVYLPFAFVLFFTGLAFGLLVVVRLGYRFLLRLAPAGVTAAVTMDNYLSFIFASSFACGLVFLLPVIVLLLVKIGALSASFLWRQQKRAVLALLALVALITPTVDAVSLLIVFLPLLLLFELSLGLALLAENGRRKRAACIARAEDG